MKKNLGIIILMTLSILVSGCNLPGESEPTVDIIATQVARMLTESALEEEQTATESITPSPTATELIDEATVTPTNSATETPTATQDERDPAVQFGDPTWTEDFSGSSSPWDFNDDYAAFDTNNNFLNLTSKASANWHSWYVSSPKLKNAYIEATIQMSNCSGLDRFGLAVRASSDGQQFYFMGITCDGQWGFYRMAPDIDINQIVGYQSAEPLSEGTDKTHRVGILMKGSSFTFYIDGEEVGTASDSMLTNEGYTGFLIAFANNPGFTVKVDELKYWNVP